MGQHKVVSQKMKKKADEGHPHIASTCKKLGRRGALLTAKKAEQSEKPTTLLGSLMEGGHMANCCLPNCRQTDKYPDSRLTHADSQAKKRCSMCVGREICTGLAELLEVRADGSES